MGIYSIAVNEVYYGRTPEIEACYQQFSKFRQKHISNTVFKYDVNINMDPDLIKFNRMMEDCFGFDTFELYIENSQQMNAYTVGVARNPTVDLSKVLVKTSKGIKYNKDAKIVALTYIYTGLLMDSNFTDGEIFAIILHEIGHNFQQQLVKPLVGLSSIGLVLGLFIEIMNSILTGKFDKVLQDFRGLGLYLSNNIRGVVAFFQKLARNNNTLNIIINWLVMFKNMIFDTITDVTTAVVGFIPFSGWIAGAIDLISHTSIASLFMLPWKANGVAGEYFADSFPVIYGFGPEMSSGIYKLDNAKGQLGIVTNAVESNGLLRAVYNFNMTPAFAIGTMFDEHPTYIARMKGMSKTLEKELEKEKLDPKMRKIIKEDLDSVNKNFNTVVEMARKMDKKQKNKFFSSFCLFMYNITGSDNKQWVKDAIDVNKETDKTLDSLPESPIEKIKFK